MLTELLINLFRLSPICCAIFIQHIFVTGSVCQVAFDLQMSSYLFCRTAALCCFYKQYPSLLQINCCLEVLGRNARACFLLVVISFIHVSSAPP